MMKNENTLLSLWVQTLTMIQSTDTNFSNYTTMKRITQIILLLVLLMPATATAYDFEVNGIYYNINGYEATVTYKDNNFKSYNGSVTIPSSVTHNGTTYSVTAIGEYAFYDCLNLTSITIPNSIISIGDVAFFYCYSLTSIDIPNSVTSIGADAFFRCYSLTSITIPKSVTFIGKGAFYDCIGLTSITVDNGNPTYDSRNGCNAIIETASNTLIKGCMNTVIPNSVTIIYDNAFTNCHNMTSVTIPNALTSIGYEAFAYCSSLTNVTIPNSVTAIGEGAFKGCTGLTSITVDNGNPTYDSRNGCNAIIETASNTLFSGCKNTVIPNTVVSIGSDAFNYSSLTSITIPNSVTSIGSYAFHSCSGLTSIDIPNSVTTIGLDAFSHCTSLTNVTIGNSVTTIGNYAFDSCYDLISIDIPNSVTSIGVGAFLYCYDLTSVTIGSGVTAIGSRAFYPCNALASVKCIGTVPPVMASTNCFSVYNSATLFVPSESVETYQTSDYWYKFAHIDTLALPTLNEALNCNGGNINFTSTGNYPWKVVIDGSRIHAQSGNGGVHNSSSTLTATVSTPQGGTLSFEFKAWGEGNEDGDYDLCIFNVDGVVKLYYADLQNNWVPYTTNLTPGTHTLTWTYSKDESVNPRGDYFAIDNVYLDLPVIRGDVNGDGGIDISDVTALIDLLLNGGEIPAGADVNGDGHVDISDVTTLIDRLLSGN